MENNRFYTSIAVHGNRVLVREIVDGIENRRIDQWGPTLYRRSKASDSDFVSLFKEPAKSVTFDSISDAKDFLEQYKDVSGMEIYGQTNWLLQYIHQYRLGEPVFSQITVCALDIETRVPESGFPKPINAEAEIVLISCKFKGRTTVTFGLRGYKKPDPKHPVEYIECGDETTLLSEFLNWWENNTPAVVTGWNIEGFDLPYLANRITKVMGQKSMLRLSPWRLVKVTPSRIDAEELDVEIVGVAILDYLALMKKYTYGNRPSWSLGSVCAEELGHTKLDHSEYSSFNEFMDKDWDKFVLYNIIDAELVMQLDDKMQLLDLAYTIAYTAKINFQDIYSPVKTWDAIIHNALLDKGVVIPQRKSTGFKGDQIEGAYVKIPVPGMYKKVASVDATSLYPSIMKTLNISPETYVGMTDSSVDLCLHGRWPEVEPDIAVGANGAMFRKTERGIIPYMIDYFMKMRKTAKSEMLTLKSEYEKTKDERLKPKIAALDNKQMAAKILMNSLYGAIANNGFRFFNPDVAETITTTGQLYLRSIDNRLSPMLAKKFGIPMKDYVIYADTDSLYLHLEAIIDKYMPNETSMPKIIKAMEMTVTKQIQPMLKEITDDVSNRLQVFSNDIVFKLEIAADKAIYCAKKKYACRVYSSEGVTYTEPELKVMGLEMVRSSTPKKVREALEQGFKLIFSGDEESTQEFISEIKDAYYNLPVEDIARISGVNNLDKNSDSRTIYNKSASIPIHVRAALLYNHLIMKHELQTKYPLIKEGDKLKYVYLKMPNTLKENVIAWPVDEELPKEFGLHKYIDYEVQFEKTFLAAIGIVLSAIKWSPVKLSTLDDFFS